MYKSKNKQKTNSSFSDLLLNKWQNKNIKPIFEVNGAMLKVKNPLFPQQKFCFCHIHEMKYPLVCHGSNTRP